MNAHPLRTPIETAAATSGALSAEHSEAVESVIKHLEAGTLRVSSRTSENSDAWETHAWIKQAILLYFRVRKMETIEMGPYQWADKIPVRRWTLEDGVRAVPPATVRAGAHIARGVVLMPSYVNIGAFVDEGTMVDTWATVGSCAQVGKNVHLSGGVGLGGVLEPAQAQPVIIEDGCFLGSRVIVVEGVRICAGAVLGAGVVLTQSTPIIDVRQPGAPAVRGVVPPNAVVIPGTRPKTFAGGEFQIPCALIIGQRSPATDLKTSLNQALRDFDVPV